MKKRYIHIIILFIIIFIGALVFFLGDGVVVGQGQNQNDINLELGIWTSRTKFEQTFIALHNKLSRIDFYADSYHPWDNPYLDFHLYEIDTEANPAELTYEFIQQHLKEVRYKRINGWLISGHMFNSVVFPPIDDSQDKRYLLTLQSPELKEGGSSILLASPKNRYDFGSLFVDGEQKEGELAFRVLYRLPRYEIIQKSFSRLALQKPFPFSKPGMYYLLFGSYILLLFLVFVIL